MASLPALNPPIMQRTMCWFLKIWHKQDKWHEFEPVQWDYDTQMLFLHIGLFMYIE